MSYYYSGRLSSSPPGESWSSQPGLYSSNSGTVQTRRSSTSSKISNTPPTRSPEGTIYGTASTNTPAIFVQPEEGEESLPTQPTPPSTSGPSETRSRSNSLLASLASGVRNKSPFRSRSRDPPSSYQGIVDHRAGPDEPNRRPVKQVLQVEASTLSIPRSPSNRVTLYHNSPSPTVSSGPPTPYSFVSSVEEEELIEKLRENSLRDHDNTVPPVSPGITRADREKQQKSSVLHINPEDDKCVDCGKIGNGRLLCNVCNETFCSVCWDKERAHRTGAVTTDGVPHEKTDRLVAQKIHFVLDAGDSERQAQLHKEDDATTWFGVCGFSVGKDQTDDVFFEDFGRYASIIAEGVAVAKPQANRRRDPRYPGLVSFVGVTGAGKSTLIKMLIELQSQQEQHFESPVVGAANEHLPTSGDVHLYKDPRSYHTKYPILYADCEGLQGGEREPLGAKSRHKEKEERKTTASFGRKIRKAYHSSRRELQWAKSPEQRTRQYAVTHLYPRLLFTFSDVIVFVSKNARVIENTMDLLVGWAAAALEKSSNQPVLPHLIIVSNESKSESKSAADDNQWDVSKTTQMLLDIPMLALEQNPNLEPLIKYWTRRGRPITTALDLLMAYYKTVKVVRMPTGARPKIMNEQATKLYDAIANACTASREQKHEVRMLLSADDLEPYLQYAFDHFCANLNEPFDFVKASWRNNVIPNDFGGSILRVAINMKQANKRLTAHQLLVELSAFVASCIVLDSTRKKIVGHADDIFPHHYMTFCDDALFDFCDQHWPCEYKKDGIRCVNVRAGHAKGHQSADGKLMKVGDYESKIDPDCFLDTWRGLIYRWIEELLKDHVKAPIDSQNSESIAFELHRSRILKPFFKHLGSATKFISHSTCYACLMALPEHPLPCGHIICTPCLQSMGKEQGKTAINITQCPLEHENNTWPSWLIPVKPLEAGTRILVLDGGGIRGIAELEALRQLEALLGGRIPVQAFFDLIVGTSAGGLVALGLGVINWRVQKCAEKFQQLCSGAFTLRKGLDWWVVGRIVQAHYNSKYETTPLEETLTEAFTERYLFGGSRSEDCPHAVKVALVSTSSPDIRPVVFANYNRLDAEESANYAFQRPEKAKGELKIWEAARGTSAAPTYYKSFTHAATKHEYLDGGLFHNNPVNVADTERKLIWTDQALRNPDIIVSIGSGFQRTARRSSSPAQQAPLASLTRRSTTGMVATLRELKNIAVNHLESSMNAEKMWEDYISVLNPAEPEAFRFQRLNVVLKEEPPKLDDVKSMKQFQETARLWYRGHNTQIWNIAKHLVATAFFFERATAWQKQDDGVHECSGHIQCRFPQNSPYTAELGQFLWQLYTNTNSTPCFVIEEVSREKNAKQALITKSFLIEMIQSSKFQMTVKVQLHSEVAETQIRLCLGGVGGVESPEESMPLGYPISGFPRKLFHKDNRASANWTAPKNLSSRRRPKIDSRRHKDRPWNPNAVRAEASTLQRPDMINRFGREDWRLGGETMHELAERSESLERVRPTDSSGFGTWLESSGWSELADTTKPHELGDGSPVELPTTYNVSGSSAQPHWSRRYEHSSYERR